MANFVTRLERAHHQELNLSRRIGKSNLQVAVFSDRVGNTALIGTGEASASGGYLLPDVYSGTFTYAGDTLRSRGVRVVLQRKLSSDLTATLDYACGDVLTSPSLTSNSRMPANGSPPSAVTLWPPSSAAPCRPLILAGSHPIAGSMVRR